MWTRLALVGCSLVFVAEPMNAQTPVEWSAETRTSLTVRVPAEPVRRLLPAGWQLVTLQDEPAETTLSVTFMERHLVLDAKGQPVRTGSTRYAVVSVQARQGDAGQPGAMIVAGISPEGAGAYGVYQTATVAKVERRSEGQAEEGGIAEESWEMAAASGDRLTLNLRYRRGTPVRRQSTTVIRSGAWPEFTRTYRIDQLADALGGPNLEGTRLERFSFSVSGPTLTPLFNRHMFTNVTAIPWYTREIFIP